MSLIQNILHNVINIRINLLQHVYVLVPELPKVISSFSEHYTPLLLSSVQAKIIVQVCINPVLVTVASNKIIPFPQTNKSLPNSSTQTQVPKNM